MNWERFSRIKLKAVIRKQENLRVEQWLPGTGGEGEMGVAVQWV